VSGEQVVVGGIPQEPPGFQPRAALLANLDQAGAGAPAVRAVTGRRGVGKTQLVAACARAKLAEGWRLVAWVNAENTGSLLAGLAAVADAVALPDGGSGSGVADAVQAVRRRLEADGDRCLIVFDDASDPDALRPFLPADGAATVLITSPRQSLANLGTNVPVGMFTSEEATAFLTSRTGLADEAGAAAVAAELGCLPLALAQVASVVAARHLGYEAYLEQLRATPVKEYLSWKSGQRDPPPSAAAVLLSLEEVRAADRARVCTAVMEIISVLSPAGIRQELLHAAAQARALSGDVGRMIAAPAVDRALAQLAELSLLTFSLDGRTVITHRMVTQVARAAMARRERLTTACRSAASALVAGEQALYPYRDRPAVRDFVQQVVTLQEHAARPGVEPDEKLARLLLRLRFLALHHLNELGDNAVQAIAVGEPLTADLERLLGPDHPDTMKSRNNLAAAYRMAGLTPPVGRAAAPEVGTADRPAGQAAAARVGQAVPPARRGAETRVGETVRPAGRAAAAGAREAVRPAGEAAAARVGETVRPAGQAAAAGARGAVRPARQPAAATVDEVVPAAGRAAVAGVGEVVPAAGRGEASPPSRPAAAPARKERRSGMARRAGGRPVRRRIRVVGLWATLIVLAASGVIIAFSVQHGGGRSSGRGAAPASGSLGNSPGGHGAAAALQMAAEWVSQQVSRSVIVACDPQMCAALEARGVPAANLLPLGAGATSPLAAEVVVATPAVRSQFGSRLDSAYAPSVIAGFGSGPGKVSVQVIAPDGAAAYRAALRQDVAARQAAGTELLANKRIAAAAEARTQLAAGEVDSRLLIVLAALAAVHPVQILAFGDPGPGASPGVPFCSADLSGSGSMAGMTDASYLQWLVAFVRAQRVPFAGSAVIEHHGDQTAVRVEFSRPSPLGLLNQ
jgi:hypothetical protein